MFLTPPIFFAFILASKMKATVNLFRIWYPNHSFCCLGLPSRTPPLSPKYGQRNFTKIRARKYVRALTKSPVAHATTWETRTEAKSIIGMASDFSHFKRRIYETRSRLSHGTKLERSSRTEPPETSGATVRDSSQRKELPACIQTRAQGYVAQRDRIRVTWKTI